MRPIHSDAVVARARLLHSRGYQPKEISQALYDERVDVTPDCVRTWIRFRTRSDKPRRPPPIYRGVFPTWADLSDMAGIKPRTLRKRLQLGWSLERAMRGAV